jgi:hypothetical protein
LARPRLVLHCFASRLHLRSPLRAQLHPSLVLCLADASALACVCFACFRFTCFRSASFSHRPTHQKPAYQLENPGNRPTARSINRGVRQNRPIDQLQNPANPTDQRPADRPENRQTPTDRPSPDASRPTRECEKSDQPADHRPADRPEKPNPHDGMTTTTYVHHAMNRNCV